MKNALRIIFLYSISIILTIVVGILKLLTPYKTNSVVNVAIIVVGIVAIITIVAFIVINLVLSSKLTKKIKNLDIQKTAMEIVENRKNAEEYLVKTKIELEKIIRQVNTYAIVLLILIQIVSFAFLVDFAGIAVVIIFLNYACLGVIFYQKNEYNLKICKTKDEYPLYYQLIDRARRNSTYKGKSYFNFVEGDNVTVFSCKKYCVIELGVAYIATLHEEELYQVLLHEFEHIGEKAIFSLKFYSLDTQFSNDNSFPFNYWANQFCFKFSIGEIVTSILNEEMADDVINVKGNTKLTAKALTKTAYLINFDYDSFKYLKPIWLSEKPCEHYWEEYVKCFKNACEENYEFWNELIRKEIQPLITTHPIVRKRLEAIGEDIAEIDFPLENDPFYLESKKALEEVDKSSGALSQYEYTRKEYLSALETIKKWQDDGRKFSEDNFFDIHFKLDRFMILDEAEKLCDLALENASAKAILACANYHKGVYLLNRYDNNGIDLLYKAQELEPEQFINCMQVIGEYCCRMGLEKELATMREYRDSRTNEIFKYMQDVGILDRKTLSEYKFPEEFLSDIKSFCLEKGENKIKKLYGAKRILKGDDPQIVFYLTFKDAKMDQINDICNKFYNFASANEHIKDFNIHIYVNNKSFESSLKKISNSILYVNR